MHTVKNKYNIFQRYPIYYNFLNVCLNQKHGGWKRKLTLIIKMQQF